MKGPKGHSSEKCDVLLGRSDSVSALTSRSALEPQYVISSPTSLWFLWGDIALKQNLFFCNPHWKGATGNPSYPGGDLGLQQVRNLVNKAILSDFTLISFMAISPQDSMS